jgi:hypothetical protein
MNISRLVVPVALGFMCLSVASSTARADSIGINFIGNDPTNGALDAATSAGVVAQTNWNNLTGSSGTSGALNDNNGAATTTTLTFVSDATGTSTGSVSGGDEQLNNGSIRTGTGRATTFTLSNISYASYDIYVYNLAGASGQQQTTLGGTSFFGISPSPTAAGYIDNNPATPFTYTQATSTDSAAPTANANYVRFTGLSGTSQSFNVTGLTAGSRVQGIQVVSATVATPEPSTYAMMALGLVALCVLGAKRKKDGQSI